MLKTGVFVVAFESLDAQQQVMELRPWSFDNRPLIVKPYNTKVSLEKKGWQNYQYGLHFPI